MKTTTKRESLQTGRTELPRCLKLKAGRERSLKQRHPWIFSGAVESLSPGEEGEVLPVYDGEGNLIGNAMINRRTSIVGRMVSFGDRPWRGVMEENILKALELRSLLFSQEKTDAYRLVNGEGDNLPGLVVDRYADLLVVQITTWGMEKLKGWIVDILQEKLSPKSIYEKSFSPSRRVEGLEEREGVLRGEPLEEVIVQERGMLLKVKPKEGQKTGLFLDQREMRSLVKEFSRGRRVLNLFGYTGAFSVAALMGGALQADTVEISLPALENARENLALNGFDPSKNGFIPADVFTFLREEKLKDYGLVVLDPPAFCKSKRDLIKACRGYKDINRLTIGGLPSGSLLLTSSCSHFVDEKLFGQVVFEAAAEAGRDVRILQRHRMAFDHTVSLYHPEGEYLKRLFLEIR